MAGHVILFPGQGAQYLGMAWELVQRSQEASALFETARNILGYDLLNVCKEGPVEKLNSTAVSQPAIFVASLAALEEGKKSNPGLVEGCIGSAGLSLGEYTALTFAGAISFAEGLQLVAARGAAMQKAADASPSTMASVLLLDKSKVQEICDQAAVHGPITIANFLCPGNLVISGALSAVNEAEKLAQAAGAKTIRLAVAGAFHSHFMAPAREALTKALSDTNISAPQLPVWSNVTGKQHGSPQEIRQLLDRQVVEPVLWEDLMGNIVAKPVDTFYEVGPGKVLAGLLKRINRKATCTSIPA